ncbi:glycosyltransferase family 4 protein [Campylobacter concisus]|uniref:glycosyltransferase family 4 protein n=1 Tax=Campylobacter concisus TaxID=199 RepID=UPI000CD8D3DB|nr:glycosyltransferase family 4 protein [Campylobacter concisus]
MYNVKNIKILLVSSKFADEYSGSGLRAYNTYKRFSDKYGIKFDVVSNSVTYHNNLKFKYNDVDVYRISSPFNVPKERSLKRSVIVLADMLWEFFYSWLYIRKNIKEYDLLHTFGNTFTIGFLTWYFSKKNKPIIRELCNDMSNPFYPIQFSRIMQKIFSKENTVVVAISKRLEILSRKFAIKNIWSRPNPVNEDKFNLCSEEIKKILRKKYTKFSDQDTVLCHIASLCDRKNHIFLLDVLKLLPDHFKLVIGGPENQRDPNMSEKICSRIKELDLEDRIQFKVGFVDNMDEYIKLSDVFAFPSKAEGLGTPILEAQACGVPIVANIIENITDVEIVDGEGGYCSSLDPKEFADKIIMSLKIPKEKLTKNAENIINRASTKVIDEAYYKIICGLVNA